MRDVNRLRRSRSDRYIAGVAGGLGRHFDIDPTVIRVVLAVLTFFGGAGILVYGVVWLFVPEDGEDRAPVELNPDVLKIVLIVTGAIALMIVFGTPFFGNGWGCGFPFPLLVIGLVAARDLRHPRPAARPAPSRRRPGAALPLLPRRSHPRVRSRTGTPEGTTMSTTDTPTDHPDAPTLPAPLPDRLPRASSRRPGCRRPPRPTCRRRGRAAPVWCCSGPRSR